MAEKKKETKKVSDKKISDKKVNQQKTKPVRVMVKDDIMPAIDIAKIYNISSFDFYLMKEEGSIDDGTFLSISDFKKIYDKVIRR